MIIKEAIPAVIMKQGLIGGREIPNCRDIEEFQPDLTGLRNMLLRLS